jgi:hypothetical protein
MSCDAVAAAILDDTLPRPEGFQAHLEQCPRCRELSRLQASASALKLPGPPPLEPLSRQSILGEVRRRQRQRRAIAGTAVAGALAAVVLAVMPRQEPTVPAVQLPVETVLTLPALDLLIEEVESYTQRDPTFDDETYAPFGTLALWVRPPTNTALSDRSFRRALAPLHPSPTQEVAR